MFIRYTFDLCNCVDSTSSFNPTNKLLLVVSCVGKGRRQHALSCVFDEIEREVKSVFSYDTVPLSKKILPT